VRAYAVKRARAAALLAAQEHAVLAALAKRAAHNEHARHNASGCFGGGLGACFARIRPTAPAADPGSPSSAPRARPGRVGYRRSSSSSSVAAPADDVPLDLFDDDDCGVPPLPQETEVPLRALRACVRPIRFGSVWGVNELRGDGFSFSGVCVLRCVVFR
jgi:hypothetical protein